MVSSTDVTHLLREIASGNKQAETELMPLVYAELKRIARHYMRGEPRDHTLQTTALVHEAYLRLARPGSINWQNRAHFFSVAATVMRRVLVDHARARKAAKRGAAKISLADQPFELADQATTPDHILAIDEALSRLAQMSARQSRIVELRFFAGMNNDEIADALNLSPRTVKRDWRLARAWLFGELGT